MIDVAVFERFRRCFTAFVAKVYFRSAGSGFAQYGVGVRASVLSVLQIATPGDVLRFGVAKDMPPFACILYQLGGVVMHPKLEIVFRECLAHAVELFRLDAEFLIGLPAVGGLGVGVVYDRL